MLTKNGAPSYRARCLGLAISLLAGALPALGQDDVSEQLLAQLYPHRVQDGFRLGVMAGTCFHADASRQSCPLVQVDVRWIPGGTRGDNQRDPMGGSQSLRFNPGYHAGVLRPRLVDKGPGQAGAGFQGAGVAALANTWPEPPPPDEPPSENFLAPGAKTGEHVAIHQEQRKADHQGTITGLAELVLVMPVQPRFSLTPFVGLGLTHIREGQAEAPNRYAIESQTMFAASYGAEIDVRLNPQWDLRFLFRDIVHFPKTLTYIDAEGVPSTVDVATVSTSSLLVGLGYRFPR